MRSQKQRRRQQHRDDETGLVDRGDWCRRTHRQRPGYAIHDRAVASPGRPKTTTLERCAFGFSCSPDHTKMPSDRDRARIAVRTALPRCDGALPARPSQRLRSSSCPQPTEPRATATASRVNGSMLFTGRAVRAGQWARQAGAACREPAKNEQARTVCGHWERVLVARVRTAQRNASCTSGREE